ncbi:hypothetical protein H671_4g11538 [Cricetulus griseus]|uniref:Uncharacterized protein n=1 Tax=Cricetulus griseus TaxID=10029 RepID=A0A061I9N4_CRIGR|nr:hypothetical protein H671_4g11538 [Cricetulus griseus]
MLSPPPFLISPSLVQPPLLYYSLSHIHVLLFYLCLSGLMIVICVALGLKLHFGRVGTPAKKPPKTVFPSQEHSRVL